MQMRCNEDKRSLPCDKGQGRINTFITFYPKNNQMEWSLITIRRELKEQVTIIIITATTYRRENDIKIIEII